MTTVSNNSSSSVICKEVFDDGCIPSNEEINEYAIKIGINPEEEPDLLYLAKEGLMQALPSDWKVCYNDKLHAVYYYNEKTKSCQWDHPLDSVYRDLVEKARIEKLQQKKIFTSVTTNETSISSGTPVGVDNSEDVSQLDSGIRSLQGTDEFDSNDQTIPIITVTTATNKMNPLANRFLDTRGKKPSILEPIKNSRFEVTKTNPQIGLNMKFQSNEHSNRFNDNFTTNKIIKQDDSIDSNKKGFTLTGTGSMFLKSNTNKKLLSDELKNDDNKQQNKNFISDPLGHSGVKGILRDSSLTDVRRRGDDGDAIQSTTTEDKKSVRFNLNDIKMGSANSPEDPSSSKRFDPNAELSDNSDNNDDDDDDDPWDFIEDDDPIDQKHVKEIKVTPVATNSSNAVAQKQFKLKLKTQENSEEAPTNSNNNKRVSHLVRAFSEDNATTKHNPIALMRVMKENIVRPLYDDTDSESHASSNRSYIQKSEDNIKSTEHNNNQFKIQLENINREHQNQLAKLKKQLEAEREIEEMKLRAEIRKMLDAKKEQLLRENDKELGNFELNKSPANFSNEKQEIDNQILNEIEAYRKEKDAEKAKLLKDEEEKFKIQTENEIAELRRCHSYELQKIRENYETKAENHKKQLTMDYQMKLDQFQAEFAEEFDLKRRKIIEEHRATMSTLQKNHAEILQDLERDLKSEEEIVKKEHAKKLTDMKDKLAHELELEKQRMRDSGEDRMYEKVRCEKRLLEDKYRCLKEKYVRLKTDVKLSLERRNKRREQQQQQHQQQQQQQQSAQQQSLTITATTTTTGSETDKSTSNKPSIGNSDNKSASLSTPHSEQSKPPLSPRNLIRSREHHVRDSSTDRMQRGTSRERKMGIASKYIKQLQSQYQDDTTSVSQSDTTISNNFSRGIFIPVPSSAENGNSDSEAFQCNQENNNNTNNDRQRKKVFTKTKSASTSRLNAENFKADRPCTPVETLRKQLEKLEDLEDQFPDNTLDTTYHLRYPFSDISNEHGGGTGTSSELEFFKHRIHLERDSVRRAKESLRTQRTNFRARQQEIKQRHKISSTRHTLDQLIQEERELTEMEVNLHRTRALLGEKVIRLRHLEQSLQRIYEKEKPMDFLQIENKDDATLSDLSSHSSSGFSSTDFVSDMNHFHVSRRKEMFQESSECIQNLEILNAEIREILDIISKQQQHHGIMTSSASGGNTSFGGQTTEWPSSATQLSTNPVFVHSPQPIPTLADRLETYRQLAAGRMQTTTGGAVLAANTIVSQSPRAVNYTTTLVERTRDLRNWLRQAKTEHELLSVGANISNAAGTVTGTSSGNSTNQQANL